VTGGGPAPWTYEQAEDHLLSLELFGMRFGLERMRRLMTALGSPQRTLPAIHVVGTNGKSSTTRMTAAILRAHGLRAGAYLSPHLGSFCERIRVDDADLDPASFGAAVQRAARAAAVLERSGADGERVTQFELLTAAALWELARRHVDAAVVEAGLGARYDATAVVDARVVALTNVGLEHTRWLGPTVTHIAREKLAAVRPGAVLVTGPLGPEARAVAEEVVAERGVHWVRAPAGTATRLAARGAFQAANFALARAAAEAFLGAVDEHAVDSAGAAVLIPGRCEVIAQSPLTILDGAHNPDGARALAASLPDLAGDRPVVGVLSILEDKDAAGMLALLLACCASVIFTSNRNPRALPPATLQSLARQVAPSGTPSVLEPDPRRALALARETAGPRGVVLATGSIHLVADLAPNVPSRRASSL